MTHVRLYADEILPQRNVRNERWMYIGVLAIPESKYLAALKALNADRIAANYPREVHFTNLKNRSDARHHGQKTLLTKKWVQRFLTNDDRCFYFFLQGINLSNLHQQSFGRSGQQKDNIYNRFFRASIHYMLKAFFGNFRQVVVTEFFHDNSKLSNHKYFDWHTIWRIENREPQITFQHRKIQFIDSDHNKEMQHPDDSHLMQLCDVLLGGFRLCLDNQTGKEGCVEIANDLLRLAERLTDPAKVRNVNSRYQYVHRVKLSFFPSRALNQEQLTNSFEHASSTYYIQRPQLLIERISGQLSLF